MRGSVLPAWRFIGLAANPSPFHLKSGGYISDLLALWIPLTMATHLDSSRAQGTRRSLVYSTLTQGIAKGELQVRRSTRISQLQKSIEDRKPERKYSSLRTEEVCTNSVANCLELT